MTMVLPPDIELWICGYLRAKLKTSYPTLIVSIMMARGLSWWCVMMAARSRIACSSTGVLV